MIEHTLGFLMVVGFHPMMDALESFGQPLIRIVDENGGFTIIPEMHLPFLSDKQRENVRRIEVDYLSQRRVSLYIREDYIRQSMLNTITKTLLRFMPDGMMEERIVKFGIKL